MKIPKKIKVGGITYKVKQVNKLCDDEMTHGYQDQAGEIIQLKKSLSEGYKEKVLMHEIVHAIFDFLMWDHDEKKVERLAQALYMLIKDNPEMFK